MAARWSSICSTISPTEAVAGAVGGGDDRLAQRLAVGGGEEEEAGRSAEEVAVFGRAVEKVGAHGEDDAERRGGVVGDAGERGGEGAARGRIFDHGVELFELIDEEQDADAALAGVAAQHVAEVAGLGDQAGGGLALLEQIDGERGLRCGEEAGEQVGQGLHRLAAGADDDAGPGLAALLEGGDQAGADERGFADAGGADHAHQRLIAQPQGGGRDLARASEAGGVGLLKGAEAGIGALVGAQPAGAARAAEGGELVGEDAGAGHAARGCLDQAAIDDGGELVGDVAAQGAHAREGLLHERRVHELPAGDRAERVAAGEHLEHHHAHGPQVGAVIDLAHAPLLRRHIRQGAHDRALPGQRRHRLVAARHPRQALGRERGVAGERGPGGELGEAEVEHLDGAGVGDLVRVDAFGERRAREQLELSRAARLARRRHE